jgi:hypothetical protein
MLALELVRLGDTSEVLPHKATCCSASALFRSRQPGCQVGRLNSRLWAAHTKLVADATSGSGKGSTQPCSTVLCCARTCSRVRTCCGVLRSWYCNCSVHHIYDVGPFDVWLPDSLKQAITFERVAAAITSAVQHVIIPDVTL